MKLLKKIIAGLALVPVLALANEGGFPLDHAPDQSNKLASLQNGAKLFVNYCLNCHSASSMRYNRLKDIGLTDKQIETNLLFTSDKVGDLMKVSLSAKDAKEWFGAAPPDLSVIARAKASEAGSGADWLYTYLRAYYRDSTRPTGWNNALFENVGMPHVLWQLQGAKRGVHIEEIKENRKDDKLVGFSKTVISFDGDGNRSEATNKLEGMHHHAGKHVSLAKAEGGKLSAADYDHAVADLVSYLDWMAEPAQDTRKRLGPWVLMFMGIFVVLAWRLNASYWKEVK
jgi:ubiquinol-cytochrome c reductase cytochrome c1 subunit